jgi:hypothetical protein
MFLIRTQLTKLRRARKALREFIVSRDEEGIVASLARVESIMIIEIDEVHQGRQLLKWVREEKALFDQIQKLLMHDPETVVDRMSTVLLRADQLGTSGELVERGKQFVQLALRRKVFRQDLEESLRKEEIDSISAHIARSNELGMDDCDLVKRARELLNILLEELDLEKQLKGAAKIGQLVLAASDMFLISPFRYSSFSLLVLL